MKRNHQYPILVLFIISIVLSTSSFAEAQTGETASSDKTGTNPINFQRELRFYNEYSWLNTAGDGDQNLATVEFKTPFMDGKWQWRIRTRHYSITADIDNDGSDDIDESGLGDTDMRFLTVPFLDMPNKRAFAVALEVFFDTASDDALGSGTTSLGPQVFYVKFLPNGLFAPGLQYKFSVDEDAGRSKVDQVLIDLNYLRLAKDKQSWFFTDPQFVIDNEANKEFVIVDLEFGWMMTKWWPDMKGQSFYIRPSFGVGTDRPTDGSIEVGYKLIGW